MELVDEYEVMVGCEGDYVNLVVGVDDVEIVFGFMLGMLVVDVVEIENMCGCDDGFFEFFLVGGGG